MLDRNAHGARDLDLMRDEARELVPPSDAASVTALRVWHCKYRSLQPLEAFTGLTSLVVATWPDPTLAVFQGAHALRYLSVTHMPAVDDLTPLGSLRELLVLRLHTLPSWDPSGKKTTIRSLDPLAHLPSLRHLELFGVVPEDGSLAPLEASGSPRSVRVHKYAKRERDRYYAATRMRNSFAPPPPVESWH